MTLWVKVGHHRITHTCNRPWVCSTQPCPALPTVLREEASHPQQRPSAAPRTAPLLELSSSQNSEFAAAAVCALLLWPPAGDTPTWFGEDTLPLSGASMLLFSRGLLSGSFSLPLASRSRSCSLLSGPRPFSFLSGRCTELILVRNVSLFPNFFRSWFSLLFGSGKVVRGSWVGTGKLGK